VPCRDTGAAGRAEAGAGAGGGAAAAAAAEAVAGGGGASTSYDRLSTLLFATMPAGCWSIASFWSMACVVPAGLSPATAGGEPVTEARARVGGLVDLGF